MNAIFQSQTDRIIDEHAVASLEPKFDVTTVIDGGFHIFCSQIAENYIQILRKHILPHVKGKGTLRLRELRVLNCIFRFKGDLVASDIVTIMSYDPATVSRALARLEDAGMVTRTEDHFDARAMVVSLTDNGEQLAAEYRGKSLQIYKMLSDAVQIDLTQKEVDVFLTVAEKIRDRTTAMQKKKVRASETFMREVEDNYRNILKMTEY